MGTFENKRVPFRATSRLGRPDSRARTPKPASLAGLAPGDDEADDTLGIWAPGMMDPPEDVFELGFVKEWKPNVGPC